MFYKSIFQGKFDFGNVKSYSKVVRMFEHRVENYYKSDILFNAEDIFDEESLTMHIPRTVSNITDKTWKNSVDLVSYVSQFAIAGNVGAWMTEEGTILKYAWIEPAGDKAIVQQFQKGVLLLEEKGKEAEAEATLSKVIELYNRHSQAYERRGYVNYKLKKYHDAERDFGKAIKIDQYNSLAYYGRARIKMLRSEWAEAIEDLTQAIKTSLALQDIHWTARRLKAECHIHLEEYEKAEFELRFFTRRKFKPKSINKAYLRKAFYDYGKVLIKLDKNKEALASFEKALEIKYGDDNISEADKLLYRGIARKNCGKNGYISDWNQASKLGSEKAEALLESVK